MFNKHDIRRDEFMLTGKFARQGYDWWWHSFTAVDEKGNERPFFIEFFTCNPALSKDVAVLGQLPENKEKGVKPSYLMVKVGCWGEDGTQLHRFIPWKDVEMHPKAPYSVSAAGCYCDETSTRGRVSISDEDAKAHPEWMCGSGEIEWDLKIDKRITFNVGFGACGLFRAMKAFEMFWHVEGMKTAYTGTISYNGHEYEVKPETCYGYADKNWGKDFTSPWIWLASNDLISKKTGKRLNNSCFDIGGGKPKIGPIALDRKLLGGIYYEGECFDFNFSKFWTGSKTEFDCKVTEDKVIWHVVQTTRKGKLVTDVECLKKDMLLVNYEAPDGKKRHNNLWNGGNGTGVLKLYRKNELVDEIIVGHMGCEFGEYDPERSQKQE